MCFWCGARRAPKCLGTAIPTRRIACSTRNSTSGIRSRRTTDLIPPIAHGRPTRTVYRGVFSPRRILPVYTGRSSRMRAVTVCCFPRSTGINRREYPAPTLVNKGGHWVVIVGWTTDVEPLAGSSPVLQSIHYHDPEPHNVGTDTMMTAAQRYGGPWNGAVMYGGTWLNKYVAIVEPPLTKGQARVKQVRRTGSTLLRPSQAVAAARRWIAEHRLAEMPKYSLLGRKTVEVLPPLLVREEPPIAPERRRVRSRPTSREIVPHYYIVPFGILAANEVKPVAHWHACACSSTATPARSRR